MAYEQYDALGLAELVRKGDASASEIVASAIARIETDNARYNAVVVTAFDEARRRARQIDGDAVARQLPFAGAPLLLEDLNAPAAGLALTQGSKFGRHFVPDRDSEVVARLKRAGFVVLGRSNAAEYRIRAVTQPVIWGPARNPWNRRGRRAARAAAPRPPSRRDSCRSRNAAMRAVPAGCRPPIAGSSASSRRAAARRTGPNRTSSGAAWR